MLPLTLVSATYSHLDDPFVVLSFDRAIDLAALDGAAILLHDGGMNGILYDGSGAASLENPTTVKIFLSEIEVSPGFDVRLDASAANGIVALDDGAAWSGVSNLALPFP